ncbi:YhgE/Pip domain-containing protein [Bifidobacterium canis]|uniref:Phage infection protein n=1 Tax=Bifidobacterium canis TaxID=2610880 RepID=A0A7K1J4L0_9BIFI|nr:YhgE/Pip domain-containing protein [Bifidobacterium canis]MUH59420.1 phage infection protein [Bifidobacterium canis]
MRMLGKIFVDDVRHLTSNIVSIIITIGLIVIPGLFTWFNVTACWDPFSNTSNLRFAIANEDEGYKGDLLPMSIDIGSQVVDTLRANSQLDWTFTKTSDEAIDGTKSGKYYAAVVIPKDFSKNMMTFFTDDSHHATLDYYNNEKLNALAPKVTGQGADTISAMINQTFSKTLISTALNLASSVITLLDKPEAKDRLTSFNANIADLAGMLTDSSDALRAYSSLTDSAQTLLTSSNKLLSDANKSTDDGASKLSEAKNGVSDLSGALNTSVSALSSALSTSKTSLSSLSGSINSLFAAVDKQAGNASASILDLAGNVRTEANAYAATRDRLQDLLNKSTNLTSGVRALIQAFINRIDSVANTLAQIADRLTSAANDVTGKVTDSKNSRQEIKDLANKAANSIASINKDFEETIKPDLTAMTNSFAAAATSLKSAFGTLQSSLGNLDDAASNAKTQLTNVHDLINDASDQLSGAAKDLNNFNTQLKNALNTGDMNTVKQLLSGSTSKLSEELSSPVELNRKALFPVDTFGAALTPFYTFLPLWVGALLMVVTLKIGISRKRQQALGNPKPWQIFLGHYGIFAAMALMQSTFSCAGTLLFLRVQAVHPWLFMLDGWISSLVYSFFTYTLVSTFANVGKAIGVLFLVIQISGSNAAYPLSILPHFISSISPWLPVSYSVTAMRAAIAGIYENDYWIAIGKLLLFVLPMIFIGLVLRHLLLGFNRWYEAKVESTKLLG